MPLPIDHGYPARLIIPGLYGYVSATKWLSEIELTTLEAFDAYWVPLGWAKEAPILTQSRIDVPRHGERLPAGRVAIAGVAWAPDRGISAVEVRVDDGPWQAATISVPLNDATWVQWLLPLGRRTRRPLDRRPRHRWRGHGPDRRAARRRPRTARAATTRSASTSPEPTPARTTQPDRRSGEPRQSSATLPCTTVVVAPPTQTAPLLVPADVHPTAAPEHAALAHDVRRCGAPGTRSATGPPRHSGCR